MLAWWDMDQICGSLGVLHDRSGRAILRSILLHTERLLCLPPALKLCSRSTGHTHYRTHGRLNGRSYIASGPYDQATSEEVWSVQESEEGLLWLGSQYELGKAVEIWLSTAFISNTPALKEFGVCIALPTRMADPSE
jgi:hypothetical protein